MHGVGVRVRVRSRVGVEVGQRLGSKSGVVLESGLKFKHLQQNKEMRKNTQIYLPEPQGR